MCLVFVYLLLNYSGNHSCQNYFVKPTAFVLQRLIFSVSNLVIGRRILSCKLQLSDDHVIGRHLQIVHVQKKLVQISIVQTLNCLADQGTVT